MLGLNVVLVSLGGNISCKQSLLSVSAGKMFSLVFSPVFGFLAVEFKKVSGAGDLFAV